MDFNISDNYTLSLVFTVLFTIVTLYSIVTNDSSHIHLYLRIFVVVLVFLITMFIINYSNQPLHRVAFIILILFGLLIVFLNPIMLVPDEAEHYARSEILSEGVLIPHFIEGKGYSLQENIYQLANTRNLTFMDNSSVFAPISSNSTFYHSSFSQNPFYGYVLAALAILLSKVLDLSVIWSLWLGRLFNLLFYSAICTLAIKRAPKYKMPLFIVSCLPLALSQGASFSIDFLINSLSILAISSLVVMLTSEDIGYGEVSLFFLLVFLVSFIKIPYALFGFLIFIVPRKNFKDNNVYNLSLVLPFVVLIISSIWSFTYASRQLAYSYRLDYFKSNNVNTTSQANFLLTHPRNSFNLLATVFLSIGSTFIGLFKFYHGIWIESILQVSIIYILFFVIFTVFYPDELNLNIRRRVFVLLIMVLVFLGMNLIQYLTWTAVGLGYVEGMQSRYFIPLLPLFPMVLGLTSFRKSRLLDRFIIIGVILFIISFIFMTLFSYY